MDTIEQLFQKRQENLFTFIEEFSELKKRQIDCLKYLNIFIEDAAEMASINWVEEFNNNSDKAPSYIAHYDTLLNAVKWLPEHFANTVDFPAPSEVLTGYIRCQIFISLMAELEVFISKILLKVLQAYPDKLGQNKKIEFGKLLQCLKRVEDIERIVDDLACETVKAIIYEKPQEIKKALKKILFIEGEVNLSTKLEEIWAEFIELKARRDVAMHNNWERSEIYNEKVKFVKKSVLSETYLSIDKSYFEKAVFIANEFIEIIQEACKRNSINTFSSSP